MSEPAVATSPAQNKATMIFMVRHGERGKDELDDELTELGLMQAREAGEKIKRIIAKRGYNLDRLLYSGTNRTWQTAGEIASVFGIDRERIEQNRNFHYLPTVEHLFGKDGEWKAEAELNELKNCTTVQDALNMSFYAKIARERMTNALTELHLEMLKNGDQIAVIASHGHWAELATVNPDKTRFGLNHGEFILYIMGSAAGPAASFSEADIKE